MVDQCEIGLDTEPDTAVGELCGDTFTIRRIGELLRDRRQVVLAGRIDDMREGFGPVVHEVHASPQQIACAPHRVWIDVGLRQHAAAQEQSDLFRVDLVVLRLAAVNRLHIQGVAENEF